MSIFAYRDSSPAEAVPGPLAGKFVAVQPNLSIRGWPTRAGSAALSGYTAVEDATVVSRLRNAGAVISGATGMSEFGLGLAGDTAALAVAGEEVDGAIVLDLLGEARLAAARSGLFGYKPTAGIVSRYGLIGLMPSLEAPGLIGRYPAEIRSIMAVIAGADERDQAMHGGPVPDFSKPGSTPPIRTVGFTEETLSSLASDESAAFNEGVSVLRDAGIDVKEIKLPGLEELSLVHRIVGAVEASSSCGKFDGVRYGHRAGGARNWNEMYIKTRAESFGPIIKQLLFQGAYFQFENYAAFENAARVRARLADEARTLFSELDALVLPTVHSGIGPEAENGIAAIYRSSTFTLPANVLGLPALHIPGPGAGLQLIGPPLSDPGLLAAADRLSSVVKGA